MPSSSTESKKLLTRFTNADGISFLSWGHGWELEHDAGLAHEMLHIIKALVAAIHDECTEDGGYLFPTLKALDAAAPYLEDNQ